jgi:hypothetical protein
MVRAQILPWLELLTMPAVGNAMNLKKKIGVIPSTAQAQVNGNGPRHSSLRNKPTIPGYYSCNYGHGSTYGSLYWDGKNFGDWEYGKFNTKSDDSIVPGRATTGTQAHGLTNHPSHLMLFVIIKSVDG